VNEEPEEVEQEDFYYGEPIENGFAHVLKFRGHEVILMHRRKYKPCNETPTNGALGMNARTKKFLIKRSIEFLFAAAIGYAIKTEKNIVTRVDEHFDPPQETTPEEA
jgi:hypothetical protein